MKTAVSIPNSLFNAAEQFAREMQISRSALYSQALTEFIKIHQSSAITDALNKIYEKEVAPLDRSLLAAQIQSLSWSEN